MRFDNIGLFWEDLAKVKVLKEPKPKRTPPEPVWLLPTYLPNLDEARAAKWDFLTPQELTALSQYRKPVVFDIESYPNYCLIAFKDIERGKVILFEDSETLGLKMDTRALLWCLQNLLLVGFNSRNYDIPIATLAAAGANSKWLQWATHQIIVFDQRPEDVLKMAKTKPLKGLDHIDLIQVTALAPGLKKLAGRLHAKRMQDLPFTPGTELSRDQIVITRWYCGNDLDNTALLFGAVKEELKLRERMGAKYKLDLRSKSDAQMAEAIITSEVKRRKGVRKLDKTIVAAGTTFKYAMPPFIKFRSRELSALYTDLVNAFFEVQFNGRVKLPPELAIPVKNRNGKIKYQARVVTVNGVQYQMGIGGLHSKEKNVGHVSDEKYKLIDRDVTSYYPILILNSRLLPKSMGEDFWYAYNGIVEDRLIGKKAGDAVTADGLKIVVNGTFGKLLNMHSNMYSPHLGIQTTLTGQLSLLMLIERVNWEGFHVCSANTDGITVRCERDRESEFNRIVAEWERDTGFATEETEYKAVYSRDVNNYIAIYETAQKGKRAKVKGIFTSGDRAHNPVNQICTDAVVAMLLDQVPVEKTVRECGDFTKFLTVRQVNGGAVKDGEYLGKSIRWYYSTEVSDEIILAKTGGIVSRSAGGKPVMVLPDSTPQDINYDWYIREAYAMLRQLTYLKDEET